MLSVEQPRRIRTKMARPAFLHRQLARALAQRSPNHQCHAAVWPQNSTYLFQSAYAVGKEHEAKRAENGIKGFVVKRQRPDIAFPPLNRGGGRSALTLIQLLPNPSTNRWGNAPVYVMGGVHTHTSWGDFYDVSGMTKPGLAGPILVRGPRPSQSTCPRPFRPSIK